MARRASYIAAAAVALRCICCGNAQEPPDQPSLQLQLEPSIHTYIDKALPDAAIATQLWVAKHIRHMHTTYPPDRLFENSLKHRGAITDQQLHPLFLKCITPGSTIRIGALGGSITHLPSSYIWPVGRLIAQMCPEATVETFNGARSSHGALTLGMCARTVTGPALDLAVSEFSLNDRVHYTADDGTFSALPFELLTRTLLSAYDPAPAVFNLFFWGMSFSHDSAQPWHEAVGEHYDVTGISLRDLVWPYYETSKAPYARRQDVCVDGHHPNDRFQKFTAELLLLYVAQRFQEWAAGAAMGGVDTSIGCAPLQLPPPLASDLERFDLESAKFDCAIVGGSKDFVSEQAKQRGVLRGRLPEMPVMEGWQVLSDPPCIQVTDMQGAQALLPLHTQQGHVIMSNCHRPVPWGSKGNQGPAFGVNLLRGNSEPYERLPQRLVSMVDGNFEAFRVDPPLPPGDVLLEIVPNPQCAPMDHGKCDGFYSVITL